MKIEIGDKVRFLNEVGGGTVTRIEGRLVFVEDGDGFEVPAHTSEVVVIEKAQAAATVQQPAATAGKMAEVRAEATDCTAGEEIETVEDEEHDDHNPNVCFAFLSATNVIDTSSMLSLYLVNDSNYFCFFTIAQAGDTESLNLLYRGTVEPNFKILLAEKTVAEWDTTLTVQLLLFKSGKPYPPVAPVSAAMQLNPKRFFRRNAFAGNDFFYQSAHIVPLIKDEFEKKIELLTDGDTRRIVLEKEQKPAVAKVKRADTKELLEIDLHIHELIDSTAGLSNSEMLNVQLDRFNAVMQANKTNKGKRIVFIHGVGNGTLKNELRRQLDKKYAGLYYQDASFKEYGFGATMVTM